DGSGRYDVERRVRSTGALHARTDRVHLVLRELRVVEDREPAVALLAAEREVLRSDRGEIDPHALAHRMDDHLQRLAGAVGQRQRVVLAVVGDPLAGEGHPDDVDVLPGAAERLVGPRGGASPRPPLTRT